MIALVSSIVLLSLYILISHAKRRTSTSFVVWSFVLLLYYVVIFAEVVGFPTLRQLNALLTTTGSIFHPSVFLIPFQSGFDLADTLNVLMTVPLGFMLALMWKRFRKLPWILGFGFAFSLVIELGQLFTAYRATDVTDLIMNTLGVFIGWAIQHYVIKASVAGEHERVLDWLAPPLIAITCVFVLGF